MVLKVALVLVVLLDQRDSLDRWALREKKDEYLTVPHTLLLQRDLQDPLVLPVHLEVLDSQERLVHRVPKAKRGILGPRDQSAQWDPQVQTESKGDQVCQGKVE